MTRRVSRGARAARARAKHPWRRQPWETLVRHVVQLDELDAWLAAQDPDACAGKTTIPMACPVARYLRALGLTSPSVGLFGWSVYSYPPVPHPPEVVALLVALQSRPLGTVTVAEVRALIAAIRAGEPATLAPGARPT